MTVLDVEVAPQKHFPDAPDQAHDVGQWAREQGADAGLDGARIVVGGLSSGANLAASACRQARDRGTSRQCAATTWFARTTLAMVACEVRRHCAST